MNTRAMRALFQSFRQPRRDRGVKMLASAPRFSFTEIVFRAPSARTPPTPHDFRALDPERE